MKMINKTPLALAIAGLLAAAPAAQAMKMEYADLGNAGSAQVMLPTPVYADNLFNDTNDVGGIAQDLRLVVQASDAIIGRTTGFNVLLSLDGGALFTGISAGAPCDGFLGDSQEISSMAAVDATSNASGTGWVCTVAAGSGATGASAITLTIAPAITPVGVRGGTLLGFPGNGSLGIRNVQGLLGQNVTMDAKVRDPVGGNVLMEVNDFVLASSVPGVIYKSDPTESNRPDATIDVGATPTKSWMAEWGTIAAPLTSRTLVFDAGTFNFSIAKYGKAEGAEQAVECLNVTGANCGGAAGFQYAAGADSINVTISGSDFSAYDNGTDTFASGAKKGVWLDKDATCAFGAGDVELQVTGATASNGSTPIPVLNAAGDKWRVCFLSAEGTPLVAQELSANVTVKFASGTVTQPVASGALPLMPLVYNGSVIYLNTVNPGANNIQQSFMRFCNNGGLAGKVTVDGTDDAGVAGQPVTFNLAVSECKHFQASDFETGSAAKGLTGAMGAPTSGKWKMWVSGEFDGLTAQSFIRNTQAGDVYDVSNSSGATNQYFYGGR